MSKLLESRGYKVFMSRVYGIGATIVLVGALFKLTHWPGANLMLTVGLLTEAVIFFFSAFEPPHVEPDWSLVYPEFAYAYHGKEAEGSTEGRSKGTNNNSAMGKLDQMFEKANISNQALSDYAKAMRKATESVAALEIQIQNTAVMAETNNKLNKTMSEYIEKVGASASSTEALNHQIADLSKRMSALNTVYGNMLSAMNVKS